MTTCNKSEEEPLIVVFLANTMRAQQQPAADYAQRLGYATNAKLLIIHGDDLGTAHSVDEATFYGLTHHAISSASVIVPAPWLTEVAVWAKDHPGTDIGIHIALTSEWDHYRWRSAAPIDQVPSLLDPKGYLWANVQLAGQHENAEDAYREIRAEVGWAEKLGIHPTHMDTHMGTVFQTPALYAAYVKAAHEFHLPFMALHDPRIPPQMMADLNPKDIVLDHLISIGPGVPAAHWMDFYKHAMQNMQPGLNLMIVHLGYDNAELEAITENHPDWGAAWRQREFNAVTSPEFKRLLEENHIIVVRWKDLGKLM